MAINIVIEPEDVFKQIKFSGLVPEAIKDIKTRFFIRESANILGIKVDKQDLQASSDNLRLTYNLLTPQRTYDWLRYNGLSLEEFQEMAYDNLLLNKLTMSLFSERIESYFNEKKLDYFDVAIYQIVLEDPVLAMQLYGEIEKKKRSFYEVAQEYIKDIELRRRGGYIGKVKLHSLQSEITQEILSAKPPQLLRPIITSNGVHLILVEEITEPQLDHNLQQQILLSLLTSWLKDELGKAKVFINLPMNISQSKVL